MGEMKVPEMQEAMREVGKMVLGEIENGHPITMMTEMGVGGALANPYHFCGDECATVERFMASARIRICERVKGGATVVLVGVPVRLNDNGATGVDALSGTAVFGVNRRETAADLYTRTGDLADKIRAQSEAVFVRTLRQVSEYLFKDVPWPTVH